MSARAREGHRVGITAAVATITLDRPASANALTRALLLDLHATLRELERDASVRAVVITGEGNAFCAGQALDDPQTFGPAGAVDFARVVNEGYNPVITRLLSMEKPVIAAVNGVAAGAGFGLALACDFRIVADSATFITAFAKIGLVPDSGISFLLPRMVGSAKALELCVLSERIDCATAERLGLVTRRATAQRVVSDAQELAAQLASGPRSLGLIKRELLRNGNRDVADALAYEAEMQGVAGLTHDAREGIDAFTAKRAPRFRGD